MLAMGLPMVIWAGTVETPLYDLDENKFNLRAQWLKTTRDTGQSFETIFVYYDKDQNYYVFKSNETKERTA